MEKRFTSNDIIRDLYNESSFLEKMAIQKAKKTDFELEEEYKALSKGKDMLNSIQLNAPASVIQNILDYSLDTKLETELG